MKLGCRWDTEPPCKEAVVVWRRIILDTAPVAQIGLCTTHAEVFDWAVTRGGITVCQELDKPLTVKVVS